MMLPGEVVCKLCVQVFAFGYLISEVNGRLPYGNRQTRDSGSKRKPAVDNIATEQRFLPSFSPIFSSPPLGHSRPQPFHQEPNYRQAEYNFRDLPFAYTPSADTDNNVLGSGNFGVIRGGTYYTEERDEEYNLDQDLFPFYNGNNGHGRPSLYHSNPPAAFRHGGDFFANFRDFADITAPTKSSYSEYYVVYVNKNSTKAESDRGVLKPGTAMPKNIIEQLNSPDPETEQNASNPTQKLSKAKQKLARHQERASQKDIASKAKLNKLPKEPNEPLLALS